MKEKCLKKSVEFSSYCWVVSALVTALLCGICVYIASQPDSFWGMVAMAVIIVPMLLSTLLYMPLSISVDSRSLNINRILRTKSIPTAEIAAVRLCPPTMGAIRICGCGGFFGWYGWFHEKDLGKYFAYYGKASDCFLITLKDGRKYMLGCKDAPEMVSEIKQLAGLGE